MMCERAGEVTAQTRSKSLQLGAIFRAYSKVRTYVRTYVWYLSKQLYNPQHFLWEEKRFVPLIATPNR